MNKKQRPPLNSHHTLRAADLSERLFALLELARREGATFSRVQEIDAGVRNAKPALFVKHDIHASPLDAVMKFAEREVRQKIWGTFFFMLPGHPCTQPVYSPGEQLDAMKAIQSMGHEIGVHLDPFYLIHHFKGALQTILLNALEQIRSHGIDIRTGNIHGHTGYKGLDRNGRGTSFDFFEEIQRQPDYPELRDLDPETAGQIRKHRTTLASLGIDCWADTFLWSRRTGCVELPYLSDNDPAKKGAFRLMNLEGVAGHYAVSDRHPPGAMNAPERRHFIPIAAPESAAQLLTGVTMIPMRISDMEICMAALSKTGAILLLHPQYYI